MGAGDVDASNSRLFGAGLQAVQLGRESQLFCELADAFGNKVESAAANGADLQVWASVPKQAQALSLRLRHVRQLTVRRPLQI